jgi:galacturan 1,4-alpha-galacturonidase
VFDRCAFHAESLAQPRPRNIDGFDTINVDDFRLTNSNITVDGDCFAAKSNTSNLFIENVWCEDSHGISMGSIGNSPGVRDYIQNVFVRGVTLNNGVNGLVLKTSAGRTKGYGIIKNVTFEDIRIYNTDRPLVLDQCYETERQECATYPSQVNISDISFRRIQGTSSGKAGNIVGSLICATGAECKNFDLQNIDISPGDQIRSGDIACDGIKGNPGTVLPCRSSRELPGS